MIKTRKFGTLDNREITEATLTSDKAEISILNYGCVVRDWRVRTNTDWTHVVLGFDSFENYPKYSRSFGIIAGRVANRTGAGKFSLNGQDFQLPINNGPNHLHGGVIGLGRRVWDTETTESSVILTYHSPDGEEGYPANVNFRVEYSLSGSTLTCEISATTDAPTPINIAQHSYYNLNGFGDVRDHEIQVLASNYTPTDETQIPTGTIDSVVGTRYDFTQPTRFSVNDPDRFGVDMNLVLDTHDRKNPSAIVSVASGLTMRLWTNEPGLQIFNARDLQVPVSGINGQKYQPFSGLCLEAQHFPDSANQPDWPSIIYTPERPYYQKLVVDISDET